MPLLSKPDDIRAFFAAAPDGPCFVTMQRDGDTLLAVGVSFGEEATSGYVPTADTEQLVALVAGLMQYEWLVYDAADMASQFGRLFRFLPPVKADMVFAQNLLRNRVPTLDFLESGDGAQGTGRFLVPEHGRARRFEMGAPVLYAKVRSHYDSLLEYGLRVPYETELFAAMVLAQSAAQGYKRTSITLDERVFPTWRTQHVSGSALITAAAPSLTSLPVADRRHYPADVDCRWVQIEWPYFDIEVLAARSGDTWLIDLAKHPDPYGELADLWKTTAEDARRILARIIGTGPDLQAFEQKGGQREHLMNLMVCCPDWVHWAAELREQTKADPCHSSFLGRLIRVDEPRKAHALDIQTTQAMLLKMLIGRVHVDAEGNPDVFANLHALIPVYSKLAYQIDVHVPLAHHVPVALHLGQLMPAKGVTLRPQVSMGPSWGQLTVATASHTSQAEQDLLSPASYFFLCPHCERVAQDEATFRQHLAEDHDYDPNDVTNFDGIVERSKTLTSRAED